MSIWHWNCYGFQFAHSFSASFIIANYFVYFMLRSMCNLAVFLHNSSSLEMIYALFTDEFAFLLSIIFCLCFYYHFTNNVQTLVLLSSHLQLCRIYYMCPRSIVFLQGDSSKIKIKLSMFNSRQNKTSRSKRRIRG